MLHNHKDKLTFICEECEALNHLENYKLKKHNIFECKECGGESYFENNIQYIYLLDSNYSDLIKLGYTSRKPIDRLREINSATGAIPWDLAISYKTLSGFRLEQLLYTLFEKERISNKEQINGKIKDIVQKIYSETGLAPSFIREEINSTLGIFEKQKSLDTIKKKVKRVNRKPIHICPNCGEKNPNPFSQVRTYCSNCERVIPKK